MLAPGIAQLAVAAPGLPDGVVGWTAQSSFELFQSLPGKVAIGQVQAFDRVQWGFVASEDSWSPFRRPNESATDFAIRTRLEAREWIEQFPRSEVLFVIEFDDQAEAAEAINPR
ncbi:MAG: hypothetical protein K2Y23_15760 [Cyanobacteria bacterium]|nr:hypothetical protein [Cyanobacteriota bacterium]